MSRLGRTPIPVPKGVEVKATKEGRVDVKGQKGTLHLHLPEGLTLKIDSAEVLLECKEEKGPTSAIHGLYRALLKNHIIGVSEGYEVILSLIGVGYRANVQGTKLDLQVGYSHPTALDIPKSIQVAVDKGVTISIKGIDKNEVGRFAAQVRAKKPPEPYKGKGIRYKDEYVRKKEGKAAKGKV